VATGIVAVLSYVFYSKKKAESLKEDGEILRWIADHLLVGETPENIKKAVEDSGMDSSLVDRAKGLLD